MDDTTLSEILDVSRLTSGEPIGKMQDHLNSVIDWSNDQDMILNRKSAKTEVII